MIRFGLHLIAVLILLVFTASGATPALSPEGVLMQRAHAYLFNEFSAAHLPELAGKKTDRFGQRLLRVKMKDTAFSVNGDAELRLPEGTQRVAPFCRYFELHGTDLHQLGKIRLLPAAPDSELPISTKTPTVYRVKVPALSAPDGKTPRYRLKVSGKAEISEIHMVPFNNLMETFDDIPFRNLGHEFPPQKTTVTIDTTRELSIAGHIELDRSKWFRYYGKPGTLPKALEDHAMERGFLPGRQMLKFEPAFVKGYDPKAPKLKEDPERPGHADPDFFRSQHRNTYLANATKWYSKDTPFAMCFNDYPEFMSVKHTGRGTPLTNRFPAAAELVSDFLKNQIRHSGRTATWWELKNEATIKAEWDYHWKPGHDSWGLMAEFHNTVADRVHREVPGVRIGGPASAWMQVQVKDFILWRNQARFMDLTKGHLDFYSHHFYEDMGTIGAHARRDRGYRNYLLGRMEAILDMFRAHMEGTANVRPILLTELGSLNIGSSEADYWLRLRTYSAMITRLMDRPHQIDLAVSFIFLASPWDPSNGHAVFVPKDGKLFRNDLANYERSKCGLYLDLWRDFRGRRLPVESGERHLKAIAVHNGGTVRIALSNMSGRRQHVNLKLPRAPVESVRQRRLYRFNGEIIYADSAEPGLDSIPIEVEETCIVTVRLKNPLSPTLALAQREFHAAQTAVPMTDQPAKGFEITIPTAAKAFESCRLIVGLHRNGGLDIPIMGTLNGHPFKVDTTWSQGLSELFAQFSIDIPPEKLKQRNRIKLSIPSKGVTLTSLHLRTTTETKPR